MKLPVAPEWAQGLDDEPVKIACWFEGASMHWHAKWPGVIEIVVGSSCKADWIIERYLGKLYHRAREMFAGVERIIVRPASATTPREVSRWAYASGMPTSRSTVGQERVSAWLDVWRNRGLTDDDLDNWRAGKMPAETSAA